MSIESGLLRWHEELDNLGEPLGRATALNWASALWLAPARSVASMPHWTRTGADPGPA